MRREKISYEERNYRSPLIKKGYLIEPSRDEIVKQFGMSIINFYLDPIFNYFKETLPEEKKVTINIQIINSLCFSITTEPFIPLLQSYCPYKEAGLVVSALEYALKVSHFYGIIAFKSLSGGFSFSKCLDEQAEKERLAKEILSYKEMNLKQVMKKAKMEKTQALK